MIDPLESTIPLPSPQSLARMIDHSLLHPMLTDEEIIKGCDIGVKYKVAAICVKPYAVSIVKRLLEGTDVKVCAVASFPHGNSPVHIKCAEIEWVCKQGASEVDVVVNVAKVLSKDWKYVEDEIASLTKVAHDNGAIIKIIFETDFLREDDLKITLCKICSETKVDFVKTSTGYGFVPAGDGYYWYQGATEHDVRLMRSACASSVKIKAAGAIRTPQRMIRLYVAGAERFGLSATEQIINEYQRLYEYQSFSY